jgi:RNA polymerase sigma-70 factor (ECF subfamily)
MHDMTFTDLHCSPAESAEASPMDEEEFRAFYERTSRLVWAYLTRLTGDRQSADDLLQETYYRFVRAQGTFENDDHRRNLLFRIATNLANDAFRRGVHRKTVSLDDVEPPRVDGVAERAEGRTDLARAIAQLTEGQREMLWLAYAHGSSHAEIADAMGLKTASIKLLLFRARRKLAHLLQGGKP